LYMRSSVINKNVTSNTTCRYTPFDFEGIGVDQLHAEERLGLAVLKNDLPLVDVYVAPKISFLHFPFLVPLLSPLVMASDA
jgi:hypothetical protein